MQEGNLDHFLESLGRSFAMPSSLPAGKDYKPAEESFHYYYGDEGKREAVLAFLDKVIASKKPTRFKLFSDENISWMTADKDYTKKWFYRLYHCLQIGCKMTIVHNVSRNLDEMMKAIEQWLPLYMVADIEPYYYPKVKDGVYRRTIFIAKNILAISSLSVGDNTNGILNCLIEDKKAVRALETEFDRYLSLCKPLFEIKKDDLTGNYLKLYEDKIIGEGDFYYMGAYPTFYTMPEGLAKNIESKYPDRGFLDLYNFARNELIFSSTNKALSELVNLSTGKEGYGVYFGNEFIEYSKEDFLDHLAEIKNLSRSFSNYNVYSSENINPNISILMREERGVIIERRKEPFGILYLEEENLRSALSYYIKRKISVAKNINRL